jgi:rare lipoprotein A
VRVGPAKSALVALALAASVACGTTRTGRGGRSVFEEGIASFYSDALAGHRTASGEVYDPNKLTCAHRSLPFGTRVEVTALRTRASAVCRVNDRGPYAKGRIIDLSRGMGRALGVDPHDVYKVEIRVTD